MTYRSLIKEAIDILNKNKIEDSDYDAKEILMSLVDIDMTEFLNDEDTDLEELYDRRAISNIITNFDELVGARAQHYPLQYILGETYFCGLKFLLDKSVLIPRSDTEVLVEKVLFDNPDKNKYVLDMCTGSGCIAIALANLGDYKFVLGSDISDDAIEIASKNAEEIINDRYDDDEMNQQIYFLKSDLFSDFDKIEKKLGVKKFDIITVNPPYIRSKDIKKLQKEVKDYEPILALDGGDDGLKYYKLLASSAKEYLNDNGKIYLEIGYDQEKDVRDIFEKKGYKYIETVKDLGGNDRVVVFEK